MSTTLVFMVKKNLTRRIWFFFCIFGGMYVQRGFSVGLTRVQRAKFGDFLGICWGTVWGWARGCGAGFAAAFLWPGSQVAPSMLSKELLGSVPERISGKIGPGTVPEPGLRPPHLVPSLGAPWVGLPCERVR